MSWVRVLLNRGKRRSANFDGFCADNKLVMAKNPLERADFKKSEQLMVARRWI
jgi:hypothetical protein